MKRLMLIITSIILINIFLSSTICFPFEEKNCKEIALICAKYYDDKGYKVRIIGGISYQNLFEYHCQAQIFIKDEWKWTTLSYKGKPILSRIDWFVPIEVIELKDFIARYIDGNEKPNYGLLNLSLKKQSWNK